MEGPVEVFAEELALGAAAPLGNGNATPRPLAAAAAVLDKEGPVFDLLAVARFILCTQNMTPI